jgi:hypothetical protein
MRILSSFGNEFVKHKLTEVDVMYKIKISVIHRLYQQISK